MNDKCILCGLQAEVKAGRPRYDGAHYGSWANTGCCRRFRLDTETDTGYKVSWLNVVSEHALSGGRFS